jgi:hypothetical protein
VPFASFIVLENMQARALQECPAGVFSCTQNPAVSVAPTSTVTQVVKSPKAPQRPVANALFAVLKALLCHQSVHASVRAPGPRPAHRSLRQRRAAQPDNRPENRPENRRARPMPDRIGQIRYHPFSTKLAKFMTKTHCFYDFRTKNRCASPCKA